MLTGGFDLDTVLDQMLEQAPSEVVNAPSLSGFKRHLDNALTSGQP